MISYSYILNFYRPASKNAQDDFPPLDDESNYLFLVLYVLYTSNKKLIFFFLVFDFTAKPNRFYFEIEVSN